MVKGNGKLLNYHFDLLNGNNKPDLKKRAKTNNSNKLAKKGSSKLGTLNSINSQSRVSYNHDKCIKKS